MTKTYFDLKLSNASPKNKVTDEPTRKACSRTDLLELEILEETLEGIFGKYLPAPLPNFGAIWKVLSSQEQVPCKYCTAVRDARVMLWARNTASNFEEVGFEKKCIEVQNLRCC